MIKRIITGVLVVGLFLAVAAGQCLRNVAEAADLMTNPSAETVSGTAPVGWSQGGRETYSPGIAGTANLNPGCNPFPSVSPTPSATPSPTRGAGDIIPNPGLETAKGTAPDGWTADSWGTNTPIFT